MAIENPTFNLKTGADSDLIISREVTESGSTKGKIKRTDKLFRFPSLVRRTGDTITGTTENIESSELKHGRTKSAPRKGTSSSSGDINFEFSPETFDDMLEAVLRGEWTRFKSDTNSPSNKDGLVYTDGFFATKCATGDTAKAGKRLIYVGPDTENPNNEGLVHVANNGKGFVVHELNSGTYDVKYSILRKYGGQKNEDLWQEFCHCALNTLQLSVEINSIITGSFGVMGTNNPKIYDDKEVSYELESRLASVTDADSLAKKGDWAASTEYAVNDVVYETSGKKWYKCTTAHTSGTAFAGDSANWTEFESHEFINAIPEKATDTMQFTAREGFLYVNGRKIQYAQSLSLSLDNGLTPKYAIFVPNAISVPPLTLDITGDLSTYLVNDENGSKELFNDAIADETIELMFCFQDKLEDPTALYLFQIFKAKNTENSVNGNGEDTFDVSLPWSSFDEQAMRVFRIMLPRAVEMKAAVATDGDTPVTSGNPNMLLLRPNVELEADDVDASDFTITWLVDGKETAVTVSSVTLETKETESDYGLVEVAFTPITQTDAEQVVTAIVKWHDEECVGTFTVPAA